MPQPRTYRTDDLLRHAGWLRRVAEGLVGDEGAADLVQTTWLAALRHRPLDPGPWLRRVLHNHAVSDARRRSRQRAREIAHARPEALPSTCDLAARAEATRLLVEAVLRLKPAQRDVILLRYFDELPPAAIAHRLGMPPATVRSHLARALACLRHDLDAAAGGDRARWLRALAPFATASAPATTAPLLTALTMTSTQKITASALLALVGLALVTWQAGILRPESPADPMAPRAVSAATEPGGAPPHEPEPERAPEPAQRRTIAGPPRLTKRVQVVDAATGVGVPQATVLYTKSGFVWEQLDARSKEDYSLAPEAFLQRRGAAQTADDDGIVEIPVGAAHRLVVGRKDDLYGTVMERGDQAVWRLALSPHHALVVEVFDAHGLPVPGVRILCADSPIANPFQVERRLGTTDERGRVTHLLQAQGPGDAQQQSVLGRLTRKSLVFASLPGGRHGEFALDPMDPPRQPVRITLPATGTVTVLIRDPAGNPLDPSILGDPNVEIDVLDSAAPAAAAGPMRARHVAPIAADGHARFTNVILGKTMSLSAPTLLGKVEFAGPRADQLDVLVEHRMHPDHPALVGRLVHADQRPVPDTQFGIMCRCGGAVLAMVGGRTDRHGWFVAYLPWQTGGKEGVEVTAFLDWQETSPSQAVRVPLRVPLTGRVQLGDVVMPDKE